MGLAPEKAELTINNKLVPASIWHKLVLPNETININLPEGYSADISGEYVSGEWQTPPSAGNYSLVVRNPDGERTHTVSIFVMEPSTNIDERGYLGDYRIGFYPKNTPKGFIKLEKQDLKMKVSPSFAVGQFLCKQQRSTWPKYVLVSEENLTRLERLLKSLRDDGLTDADTLFVMSGFRTPFYNSAIGSAKFSRHMYGDASDVYLDHSPRDGVMDDINGDGVINKADANFLYDYAKKLYRKDSVVKGGLGSYRANAVHGPFVHIDARGRPARWGR
ncbi:MAG: hypothetical protein EX271_01530 [Acidimicrobiales bacterium]|nr:hypothetical protein [Hyphomonadaceae bacterium]RZV44513.1 MAG: hypothetical protein EX271_01530 [Acidimicrobiales bacterium]